MVIPKPDYLESRGLSRLLLLFFLPSFVIAQTPVKTIYEPDPKEIEFLEWHCFDEVNQERKKRLLPVLEIYPSLIGLARKHSRRMAEEGFFSHTDPDGLTIIERAKEAGIKFGAISENLLIIKGYVNPVPTAVERWMSSERHRFNLLSPEFKYSAVGAWVDRDGIVYFTQIFIR